MGYTLELWAVSVATVEAELRAPSIDPAALDDEERVPATVRAAWPELATQIAEVVAAGGGEVAGTLSVYVHSVVRLLGTLYGALDHTSSGGEEFRRRFLPGPVSDRVGADTVRHLLHREIAGLSWGGYPYVGWVSAAEARATAAPATAAPAPADGAGHDLAVVAADVAPLRALTRALELAGLRGLDLISVYG